MKQCECVETHFVGIDGTPRRIFHPLHSCQYVTERNGLIPAAYRAAFRDGHLDTHAFVEAMDRLWAAKAATQRAPG